VIVVRVVTTATAITTRTASAVRVVIARTMLRRKEALANAAA
jgi:hypothetical protein